MLKTREVSIQFGGLIAVNGVSLELYQGEIVGVIGPNGAGKTTLFNIITGIYSPTSGAVIFEERDMKGMRPFTINKLGIARTFQNIRLFNKMTVVENIMLGMHSLGRTGFFEAILALPEKKKEEKWMREKALSLLDIVGLSVYAYEYASSLPYGLQRRLEIARAIASDPKVLLLDEPAAGMNEQETSALMDFIHQLKTLGYSILLIEHDMRLVMGICERICVMNYGALIAVGTPEEVRANPQVIEAYLGKGA